MAPKGSVTLAPDKAVSGLVINRSILLEVGLNDKDVSYCVFLAQLVTSFY